MRLVIIESPFSGPDEAEREHKYAYRQLCIRDSIIRGESPYASHQMLTDALNDDIPSERDIGIRAGYAWWRAASIVAFYTDLGWSEGMCKAWKRARTMNIKIEERKLCESSTPAPSAPTT